MGLVEVSGGRDWFGMFIMFWVGFGLIEKGLDLSLSVWFCFSVFGEGVGVLSFGLGWGGEFRFEEGRMVWVLDRRVGAVFRMVVRDFKWSICFLMELLGESRKRGDCY